MGSKREALLKMVYALFVSTPTHLGPLTGGTYDKDDITGDFVHPLASSHAIDSVRGLLCRYAHSIPIAANNVYFLIQLKRIRNNTSEYLHTQPET